MALFSHVMKRGAYFFVADAAGNASGEVGDVCGLYFGDTRVLSRYVVGTTSGSLSVTTVSFRAGNRGRVVALAEGLNSLASPEMQVVVERAPVVADGMYERLTVTNYGTKRCELQLFIDVAADFRDMFEVRGMVREARGETHEPEVMRDRIRFRYSGRDGLDYATEVRFAPVPEAVEYVPGVGLEEGPGWVRALFPLVLEAKAQHTIDVTIYAAIGGDTDATPAPPKTPTSEKRHATYEAAMEAAYAARRDWTDVAAQWTTDNAAVNEMLQQSVSDVYMLLNDFGFGLMPSAGVPWYAVPFGRDSLITSMQLLSVRPDMTKATLKTLAHWQGSRLVPELDEEPGKIMHELRSGEMARTGEIPFRPYYGTVDATALFVVAAGEYWRWTGDRAFLQQLMPALQQAVAWLDAAADAGGDGYIRYHRTLAGGLDNQGWKDSVDAIVHRDGRLAKPPIALAEVQGYLYGARLHYANLLEAFGEEESAAEQRRLAQSLKVSFNRDFWVDETNFYAMALDGDNRPVASVASNPGQCLWTGIIAAERVETVVQALMSDDMFSGYGVRTLSAAETAYHPLSYHRGSVWPHDNSLIAMGLARAGQGAAAARIAAGLFTAAAFDRERRLPELFGGFPADVEGPVWYPVACIPQAWAAAAPFLLLQAVLGLEVDALRGHIALAPTLPEGINRVTVDNLAVGRRRLRIEVARTGNADEVDVDVQVLVGEPVSVSVLT